MSTIASTPEFVSRVYEKMECNLETIRGRLRRPLTLAEKGHALPTWTTLPRLS